ATLLNPHFAVGAKDQEGARIFYEPLAAWDPDGHRVPVLAAEIPDIENGGVAADGRSVTWKLTKGVEWHDGQPFTADDVVFNWESVSVRRVQTGRPDQGRTQSFRPCRQPAPFRYDRDEGRWRRRVGGARRDPDRRVRLRLEHAGRGRDPCEIGERRRRQGSRRDRAE